MAPHLRAIANRNSPGLTFAEAVLGREDTQDPQELLRVEVRLAAELLHGQPVRVLSKDVWDPRVQRDAQTGHVDAWRERPL